MSGSFRNALIWHMERDETKVTDLVKGSGVSRDTINKLLARENASTSVENALLIAAYYGKTVEQFIQKDDSAENHLAALSELLQPDEVRMLEAQVRGLIAQRATR
jgi:transcriptional regulator with XRE-family HTH domain